MPSSRMIISLFNIIMRSSSPVSDFGDAETFTHGKQSTLLSAALRESNIIRATKVVTCKRKSKNTANAAHTKTIKMMF